MTRMTTSYLWMMVSHVVQTLMGRCMNSLGKPKQPIGGVRGGPCIMNRRIKAGK